MSRIIAAIPAFNEEKTIGSVVLSARRHVDEVAVIDDGSTDRTAAVAQLAGATVLRHPSNRGYGAAIRTGFEYARSNGTQVLVVLDGDGQHSPEFIPNVIDPVLKGTADVCIGSRFLEKTSTQKVPAYRRFGISVLTRLTNLGSRGVAKVRDAQSGYRAYSRKAVDRLHPRETGMGASAEILWDANRAGLRILEVPVEVDYDNVDGSTEGPVRHALGVIGSMVRYVETEHALATFGLPGALLLIAGIILGFNVWAGYDATHQLAEGKALLTLLMIMLGMMLGFTGLVLHAVLNANRRSK